MKKNLTRILSLLLVLVLMVGVLPVSALADGWDLTGELDTEQLLERAEPVEMQASASDFSKILHLDCGRKYFTKDWIIALLYEMQAAGYNQLQLAFGNDGLRFLLNDMSFTANGTTYSHETVVSKVKAGNKAQNSSGDESYLTETEMTEIITKANSLGIEIVPLLNLPGHANALLDIADDAYNAKIYYKLSQNTLDVTNSEAVEFAYALFTKYVDYFASAGCKFFNFGADEYGNDFDDDPKFSVLYGSGYQNLSAFINKLAGYIDSKKMTPRSFNDSLYYNGWEMSTDVNASIKKIQCCYWSSGWGSYPVATASQIASKLHSMINTHGDFYYVLGKNDNFDSGYSYASGFYNTTFAGGTTITNPVGSMFCIWCDYPNAETETVVAQKTRLVLRAMAARMDNKSIDTISNAVVENGFNEDGTLNNAGTEFKIVDCEGGSTPTLEVGKALTLRIANGASAEWTASPEGIVQIEVPDSANANRSVSGNSVKVTALQAGNVTITATNPADNTQTATFDLTVQPRKAENITVYVGQDYSITVNGSVQVETHPDTNIATVTIAAGTSSVPVLEKITSTADLESGKTYLIESNRAVANKVDALLTNVATDNKLKLSGTQSATPPDSAKWKITKASNGYYIQSGSNYLTVGKNTAGLSSSSVALGLSTMQNGGSTYWDISRTSGWHTYHLNQHGGADATVAGGYTSDASNDAGSCWNIYKITKGTTPSTTITFHGVAEGDTTATIGGVDYNIHVVSKTLANVEPLSVEYWITNARIYTETNGSNGTGSTGKQISAAEAYDQNGYALSDLIQKNAFTNSAKKAVFWKGTLHPADNKQTTNGGDDKTNMGTDFQYVRYWEGSWSYSNDRTTWTAIDLTNQVVAYYMQVTEVTDEVTTTVVDWGENPFGTALNYLHANFILLDFAVKYESGERSPDEFPVSGKTIGFHCDGVPKRTLGRITPFPSDTHEVYMITLTPSDDNPNAVLSSSSAQDAVSEPYTYSGTEKVVWVDKEEDLGKFDDESLHHTDFKVGGEATIANGVTIYKGQGVLVTYYIRAKQTESSLTVHYFDMDTNTEFYNYQIAVIGNTVFDSNIGLNNPWKGPLMAGTVINSLGKTQTVSADLSTMPAIGANYQYSDYTCHRVERSADGKEVTLYYTFNNTTSFVVDFGLPLVITADDLNYTNTQWQTSTVRGAHYGNAVLDKANHTLTYTLTKPLPEPESLQLTVTDDTGSNTRNINIFPASNVLYEENFLTPYAKDPTDLPAWISETATQLTGKSQSTHKNNTSVRYGYDDVYTSITGRNGAWTIQGLSEKNNVSQALYTEFYGNALDVIGSCGKNTAQVMFVIYNQTTRKAKSVLIDTRYNGDTLEQVPYSHIELPGGDAHYNVMIRAYYAPAVAASNTNTAATFGAVSAISDFASSSSYADQAVWDQMARDLASFGLTLDDVEFIRFADTPAAQTDSLAVYADLYSVNEDGREAGTELAIDAFRVYRSASTNDSVPASYPQSEQNIEYWNILKLVNGQIINAYTENGTVENVTVAEYEAKGGPLDEIYLENGQSVAFKVENAGATIQVSLRAVQDATSWADATTGGTPTPISTNTEMYYTITKDSSGNFVIANHGDALLAIGNVKLPSNAKTTSASEIDEDALRASVCAALGLSAEQPQAFQPKTFTARATTLPMLRNKRVSVLITISNDVSYVTVNGVKYTPSRYYASWQKTRLIQFGETLGKYESKTYTIIAYDANGVASAPITVNG